MTEYKFHNKEMTSIEEWVGRNQYFEQAKEEYLKGKAYEMTFLPIAENNNDLRFPLVCNEYGYKSYADKNAYAYIMQKTLEKTFEQGNPAHDSALIVAMSRESARDDYKPNDEEYRRVTYAAMREHMRKDKEWFGKLTPAAQLAAIGLEMSSESNRGATLWLQQENGLNLDFSKAAANGFNGDLEDAANLVLSQAYRRVEYGNILRVEPLENRLSWEVKAAALEAQLKSHSSRGKIPSLPVFVDLLKTAEKPAQQLKLAELAKEPDFQESMRYDGFRNELRQSFKDITPCGEVTQKLFYEVLYNFGLRGINEPKLQLTDINFGTLQAAVAECKAQRIVDEVNNWVDLDYKEIAKLDKKLKTEGLSKQEKEFIEKQADDLRKKDTITGIPDIELVAKYRPQFLEQPAKMTPELCAQIVNKYGNKLSAQTQLEMMTKVVKSIRFGDGYTLNKDDLAKLNQYINRAQKLNTSSRAMKKFVETVRPIVEFTQRQYDADSKFLVDAMRVNAEHEAAQKRMDLFDEARIRYCEMDELQGKIKRVRDGLKLENPSDETLARFMKDGLAGNKVGLTYEPKKVLGLFTRDKEGQAGLADLVNNLNDKMQRAQAESSAGYLTKVAVSHDEYLSQRKEKDAEKDEIARTIDDKGYRYTSGASNRVALFESNNLPQQFETLTEQFEERSKEMQGRARTDLAMRFDGQEFAGKPLEGLVEEEKMAQDIYKKKITELRQSIKSGVKQDMSDRGVDKTPDKENPNATGKPMTAEGTKKIRRDMKNLKTYKPLVHE